MGTQHAQHAHHRESTHHRAPHQRPVAQTEVRTGQRDRAPRHRLARVQPRQPAEFQVARQQRAGHYLHATHHERETERDDDPLNGRLAEKHRHRLCQAERQDEDDDAREHGEAAELRDLLRGQVATLHDRQAQPQLVHQLDEACIDHGHREQPVIGGRDEARHDERGGPAHELREPLDASGPRDPLGEGAVEIGWGLAHLKARPARPRPRSGHPRCAAPLQRCVAPAQRAGRSRSPIPSRPGPHTRHRTCSETRARRNS